MDLITPMASKNIIAIFTKEDKSYKLLKKVFDDISPFHEKGFPLRKLYSLNTLSFDEKRFLKEILGGNYSEIIMPGIWVYSNNGKWFIEKKEVSRHGYIMKILDRMGAEGSATIGSPVSTSDYKLIGCLIGNWNDIFTKEIGVEDAAYEINMEMLEFISSELIGKFGGIAHINYDFVRAFLESLSHYDQMMLNREFGEG